ncbi:TIGR02117 family protein [Rhizobium sp. SL42]|uniref:TIGR02117 family protein n=1 Tax=Rhizobium sp. SL42 TaxID=2806346 RepID=UPI001F3BE46B|nr:TIGR02117 family protein [Rhizobium sp. SL42]UJW74470.1 TIGR02117 family protein [Rhizobium sp. SL42]
MILLLLVLGVVVPRPLLGRTEAAGDGGSRQILLLANAIHTDIALPLDEELRAEFAELAAHGFEIGNPSAVYLVVGWGGRAFYVETPTWSELKPLPVLKALTVDRSVLHLDLAGEIPDGSPFARRLTISEAGYRQLLDHIGASFARTDGKVSVIAAAGYGATDAFFEANGAFNALLGCNTWTAAGLRAAGLRTGWWTPLPQMLEWSLNIQR